MRSLLGNRKKLKKAFSKLDVNEGAQKHASTQNVSTAPAPSRRPPAPHLLRDSSHPQPLSSNPVAPGWTPPPYARDAIDQVVDKLLDDDTSMRDADNSSSYPEKNFQMPGLNLGESVEWARQVDAEVSAVGDCSSPQPPERSMTPEIPPKNPKRKNKQYNPLDGDPSISQIHEPAKKARKTSKRNIFSPLPKNTSTRPEISAPTFMDMSTLTRSISHVDDASYSLPAELANQSDEIKEKYVQMLNHDRALKPSGNSAPVINTGTAPSLKPDGSNIDEFYEGKAQETTDFTAKLKDSGISAPRHIRNPKNGQTILSRIRSSLSISNLRKGDMMRSTSEAHASAHGPKYENIATMSSSGYDSSDLVAPRRRDDGRMLPKSKASKVQLNEGDQEPLGRLEQIFRKVRSTKSFHSEHIPTSSNSPQQAAAQHLGRHVKNMEYNSVFSTSPLGNSTSVCRQSDDSSLEGKYPIDNDPASAASLASSNISLSRQTSDAVMKKKGTSEYGAAGKTHSPTQEQRSPPPPSPEDLEELHRLKGPNRLSRSPKMYDIAAYNANSNPSTSALNDKNTNFSRQRPMKDIRRDSEFFDYTGRAYPRFPPIVTSVTGVKDARKERRSAKRPTEQGSFEEIDSESDVFKHPGQAFRKDVGIERRHAKRRPEESYEESDGELVLFDRLGYEFSERPATATRVSTHKGTYSEERYSKRLLDEASSEEEGVSSDVSGRPGSAISRPKLVPTSVPTREDVHNNEKSATRPAKIQSYEGKSRSGSRAGDFHDNDMGIAQGYSYKAHAKPATRKTSTETYPYTCSPNERHRSTQSRLPRASKLDFGHRTFLTKQTSERVHERSDREDKTDELQWDEPKYLASRKT